MSRSKFDFYRAGTTERNGQRRREARFVPGEAMRYCDEGRDGSEATRFRNGIMSLLRAIFSTLNHIAEL